MSTKINGKNLSLLVNGDEFKAQGTSVLLDNEDADDTDVTFADLDFGDPKQWFMQLAALADYSAAGFWRMLWDNAGDVVAYVLKPHGNAVATADEPHFTGTVKILSKPPVGGGAGQTWNYEARLDCQEDPTLVEA